MSPTALPKRAVIALPSQRIAIEGGMYEGHDSGLFIIEAQHPFNVLKAAGYEVAFSSENGEWYPDWVSEQAQFLSGADLAAYNDLSSPFRKALAAIRPASELKSADYAIFFAAAGHAALLDFPTATNLHQLATEIYAHGGVVAAVCQGGCILGGITDADGKSLITGHEVTGFTEIGEHQMGVFDTLRSWNKPTVRDLAQQLGGTYVAPAGPWEVLVIPQGRLVTGANPQSAGAAAEAAIKALHA
ncbi:Glutathione-independent glyoxalase HSP31 [Vanrija pseudolonga]|uniref:D-lactate dehydratase n=1 Tax=Vanrija pseudolonga TaxID=143232 RepID=A0AAF0YGW0_9TREE|nr:Glutathione-independent glyoxalase HSP31 [Vanrija pseudolonga]